MQEDIVNGLSSEESQKAIQNAFIAGLDEYTKGDMTDEELREKLMKALGDIINNEMALSDVQKQELTDIFNEYIQNLDIDSILQQNSEAVTNLQSLLDSYITNNNQTVEDLKNSIMNEVANNTTLTNEQIAKLNDLYDQISNLEKKDYQELTNLLNDNRSFLEQTINLELKNINDNLFGSDDSAVQEWNKDRSYEQGEYVTYNNKFYMNITGNNTSTNPAEDTVNWKQVTLAEIVSKTSTTLNDYKKRIEKLEGQTRSLDGEKEFQFDYKNGSYGYSVDDVFRPY